MPEHKDVEQQPNAPVNREDDTKDEVKVKEDGKRADKDASLPAVDEFGLPLRPARRRQFSEAESAIEEGDAEEDLPTDKGKGKEIQLNAIPTTAQDFAPGSAPQKIEGAQESTDPASRKSTSKHVHRPSVTSVSEWSHQQQVSRPSVDEPKEEEEEWQQMPALATHRIYDDWGKVLAQEYGEVEDERVAYGTLGGAGKGYTRVQMEEDAKSATSLDDHTAYLFKEGYARNVLDEEDEEGRDLLSQMQTTKELLTEGQRVAYVGVVRLSIAQMAKDITALESTKGTKKAIEFATEALRMWGQKMMLMLYNHMEIDAREQIMVEQLADHGVLPSDLTPALMQNARVKNPKVNSESNSQASSARPSTSTPRPSSVVGSRNVSTTNLAAPPSGASTPATEAPPPAYEQHTADQLTIQNPDDLQDAKNLDLDIRWTVLCDLFLLMIADSNYDARSRQLLELVGAALDVEWQEICRFEKRVTDALEMQEQADKENWNEDEHLESRKKAARNRRLMVMGMCTVGGGLVIGLSAGLLAPVIGAGLAAGFTTIGVAGTGGFLGGTGAAALIGTTGTLIGGKIGLTTSHRRTGAVKTYEYKPLFNNKRVNLIVTVAGWMTGTVDDVRLPFSTIDPVMGDIYAVNWEPEMLRSTGQTIQILGTEALTQTIQQVLGATFLATLMAGLSTPMILAKMSYLIDNPWTVSLARADATGLILADSIIDRNLGIRPITLVGFSLGSRVIFSCLKELARRGGVGLVQNVYMFGSPVVVKKEEYIRARSIVPGRFVNGYATNDWILGYLFRATSGGIMRVAGLASVEGCGVENFDVTDVVPGHMAYRAMMPTLLDRVGWKVESLEYTEIEDPDPENHAKRQRELLDEIEAARRELDEQPEKKGFKSFFSRGKKAGQKKVWETYDERSNSKVLEGDDKEVERINSEAQGGGAGDVMFDVEAIRKEALALAVQRPGNIEEIKRHLSVREIQGTLPALKIDSAATANSSGASSPVKSPTTIKSPTKSYGSLGGGEGAGEGQGRNGYARSFTAPMGGNHHVHQNSSQTSLGKEQNRPGLVMGTTRSFSSSNTTGATTGTGSNSFASPAEGGMGKDHYGGGGGGGGQERNPWEYHSGDVDDPDFGREEEEVRMTF